ncbi:trypsin-like serine protease [Haloferula chungangensis]|uniref:Trypsin-like serine protease n=1 Tax=Haloferula chungangensis TaxID=1048331 RepID=A0ABW2L7K2_9BACT
MKLTSFGRYGHFPHDISGNLTVFRNALRILFRKLHLGEVMCTLSLLQPAGAVVIRHDLDRQAYRQLASAEAFSGVVEIEVDTGFGIRRGSGVVIDEHWVLTAAHVTAGAGNHAVQVRAGGTSIGAVELRYAGGWAASPSPGLTQGGDLVLVRLGQSSSLTPAVIAPNVSPGAIAFLGGYGRSGNGILGATSSPELLFAMNVVDRQIAAPGGGLLATDFDDGSLARNSLEASTVRRTYFDVGFDGPRLSDRLLDVAPSSSIADWGGLPMASSFFPWMPDEFLEGTTAAGDSGGALFVFDASAQQWQLAGISSWGVNPLLSDGFARTDSRYGDIALFTDLSEHGDWIAANIPEPTSLVWLGLLLLGRRVPRAASS